MTLPLPFIYRPFINPAFSKRGSFSPGNQSACCTCWKFLVSITRFISFLTPHGIIPSAARCGRVNTSPALAVYLPSSNNKLTASPTLLFIFLERTVSTPRLPRALAPPTILPARRTLSKSVESPKCSLKKLRMSDSLTEPSLSSIPLSSIKPSA